MRIDVISLFPEMFTGVLTSSILKRAQEAAIIAVNVINPRDFTTDKHHIVDDYPFGGGAGMVMKPDPIYQAIAACGNSTSKRRVILLCPGGVQFNQEKARELAQYEQLIFVCGHYEGVDERVKQYMVDESISIGDYVLTGGELPAMVIIDAVARMLPGVLGAADGAEHDSFYHGLLEYPQYTRPRSFQGWEVPEVLVSGDHAKIARWRRKQSLQRTLLQRPDLLQQLTLSPDDQKLLQEIYRELAIGG